MFHAAFEHMHTGEKILDSLNKEASSKIITRGYGSKVAVPPELSNQNWYLPVNLLAYSYCPTDRYLFLKVVKKAQLEETWSIYKGKVIDDLLPKIFQSTYESIRDNSARNLNLPSDFFTKFKEITDTYRSNFNREALVDQPPPTNSEVDRFFSSLPKLGNYEGLLASALLAHRISNVLNLDLVGDFNLMFPFLFKVKLNAIGLGIYPEAEPDFIFKQKYVGEIKSEQWREFYNVGLAAYALAYEYDKKTDINLGMVICPEFHRRRRVPIYNNSARIRIIEETWRKAFLTKRNQRIQLVRDKTDPNPPENKAECYGCGFFRRCWEE